MFHSLLIIFIQVVRQSCNRVAVVSGADVIGVDDVSIGTIIFAREEIVVAEPGQEGALGVVGGAVYVEVDQAALPVIMGTGGNCSGSDCILADLSSILSPIERNPPGTDCIEIQFMSFEVIISGNAVISLQRL